MSTGAAGRLTRTVPLAGWVLGAVLLVAVIGLVQAFVGWEQLLAPWKAVPAGVLLASFGLVFGSYALRTVRVHQYFGPDTRGGFLRSFRLILLHNLFNNLLPMRSGEASFPILMKREFAIPFSRSVPGLFYLRLLDLHFLLALGAVVLLSHRGPLGWVALLCLVPVPYAAFVLEGRLRSLARGDAGGIRGLAERALAGLPGRPSVFWWTWLWTGVNWAVKLLVFAWILRTFIAVSYPTALLGSVTGELSSVLPIHGVAGAGTYEAGVAVGLLPRGVEARTALEGGVNLHLFVLGASLLSGALALLFPVEPREPGREPEVGDPETGESRGVS